jgi:hypothetical protein
MVLSQILYALPLVSVILNIIQTCMESTVPTHDHDRLVRGAIWTSRGQRRWITISLVMEMKFLITASAIKSIFILKHSI